MRVLQDIPIKRKLTAIISKTATCTIFINQVREKPGIMFGNPEVTPGGRALKFYSSVRLELRKTDTIKQGNDIIGTRVKTKVVKNKLAAPFRQAEFDIIYGKGISRTGSILDVGLDMGIVGKSGTWFTYGDHKLGQGRENARAHLDAHPEVAAEIEVKIRQKDAMSRPPIVEDLVGAEA